MKHARFFIGLTAIILLYAGCTVETDEEPPRPVVLEISNLPTKVSYEKGEKLNLNGLKVKLYKTDGSFEVLEKGKYTAEPTDGTVLAEPGETTVKITVEGLSKPIPITVADASVGRLEISNQPTKLKYDKGEPLDLSGLKVILHKTDGTSAVLENGQYSAEPENGSVLTETGEKTVAISAKGLTKIFTVTVNESNVVAPERLEISTRQMKVNYEKGATLDLSGLEVKLYKTDDSSEVLAEYTAEPKNGSPLTESGKKTIKIMAEGLETTFEICVAGLKILQLPKTDYTFYAPLDLSGLKLELYGTDGSCTELSEGQYEVSPADKTLLEKIGRQQPVKITAGEQEETFEISVIDEYVVVDSDCSGSSLKSVPDKVKEKAKKITVPESVEYIDNSAFVECGDNLTEIKLLGAPRVRSEVFEGFLGEVTCAGERSPYFESCKNLKFVVLLDGVKKIGYEAFWKCSSLQSVVIPDSVSEIEKSAFSGCSSLQSVVIPDSVTTIKESVFSGCSSLESIEIPCWVREIYCNAFSGCSNLKSVKINNMWLIIRNEAFSECNSLRSVEMSAHVLKIGLNAFNNCSQLQEIHYGGSKKQWERIEVIDGSEYPVKSFGTMSGEGNASKVGLSGKTIVCTGGEKIHY